MNPCKFLGSLYIVSFLWNKTTVALGSILSLFNIPYKNQKKPENSSITIYFVIFYFLFKGNLMSWVHFALAFNKIYPAECLLWMKTIVFLSVIAYAGEALYYFVKQFIWVCSIPNAGKTLGSLVLRLSLLGVL